jgi:hypothetical protein
MLNTSGSDTTLTNCFFGGNSASEDGGGMFSYQSSPMVTNCTFSANLAGQDGGGMYNDNASPTMTNCTFSGNSAGGDWGGGIFNDSIVGPSFPWVVNCILWGNTAGGWLVEAKQIFDYGNSSTKLYYTCVEGWTGALGGAFNHGDDPLVVDADGPDNIVGTEDDNLRLSAGSACIDVGSNAALPTDVSDLDGDGNTVEPIPFDLDGYPRIIDGDCNDSNVVDMGAYEFNYAYMGDFDYDCDVDFDDFGIFAPAWRTEPPDEDWNRFCDIGALDDDYIYWSDVKVIADNWLAEL